MGNLSNYYIKKKEDLIGNKDCIIQGEKYRFTVLTDRLIRLEYSKDGVFLDNATSRVVFRKFPRPLFTVNESATLLQIETNYFTLSYVKNKPFKGGFLTQSGNLKVVLKESKREWYYKNPLVRNLGTINYSLDDVVASELRLDKGLYGLEGFSVLDDSDSLVLNDNDEFEIRENKGIDLYLFVYNNDFNACLQDYFQLTGYPSMIPRYALGNWWYKNEDYRNEDIVNLVKKFKEERIPIRALVLGKKALDDKTPYVYDKLNIGSLSAYLKQENIKLVSTIDPSLEIKKDSPYYEQISNYLKGNNKFIPLSNEVLGVYLNTIIRPLEKNGVDLFNIDYNNKSDKIGLWKLDHYHTTEIALTGNRGLILSRNSKYAPHRYPIIFTGKTKVNWETLSIIPRYNMAAANYGLSWVGHAIGGYYNGIEKEELYLRYIELATFSPVFILASEGGDYYKREPWKWKTDTLNTVREYMNLRERLISYLYSEGYYYSKYGIPLVQPFYYQYPKIVDEPNYKNQYFLGKEMFISPIIKPKNIVMNRVVQRIFVPEGTWFDFKSGLKYPGNKYYISFYKDSDYPVFCKAGAIIPLALTNENIPKTLELVVFPLQDNIYELYEDDGESQNYLKGQYSITNLEYKYEPDNYTFTISKKSGNNLLRTRSYRIRFKNTRNVTNINILVNNNPYQGNCYYDNNDLVIELNEVMTSYNVVINVTGKEMEISSSYIINNDIKGILEDLEIETSLKVKIDNILFSDMPTRKKRIAIKKLKRDKLEPKFIKMFLSLLEI